MSARARSEARRLEMQRGEPRLAAVADPGDPPLDERELAFADAVIERIIEQWLAEDQQT